ncbi:MAG: L-rhamnose/proton symporter RhaT [Terriglobia bacterium]
MGAQLGFLIVVLAGIATGVYFVGLKYVEPWQWENIWLVYAVLALVVMPVVLAVITAPHLAEILTSAPPSAVWHVFFYGLGWGIGSVLSGLGVARMGMALGVSVLIGIDAAVGTFVPMLINTPEAVFEKKGLIVILAVVILLLGVIVAGVAGKKRERDQARSERPAQQGGFASGLAICIFSGIFSAMMNFAFAFSQPISAAAVSKGATASAALNVVWLITLLGGFVPNLLYTGYLLSHRRTWSNFVLPRASKGWWVGLGMAAVWFIGLLFYGWGAAAMGNLGAVIGWPLFMAVLIIASTVTGFATGEWKGSTARAQQWMGAGMATLILAAVLLGVANRF